MIVHPEAVGICGSDYHFFAGELSDAAGGSQFPRVQGHEVAGTIAALGPGCRPGLSVGQRVALWPLHACGHCYPCSVGRPNTCDNFELIGIHLDGGLQERLAIGQDQVFPIDVRGRRRRRDGRAGVDRRPRGEPRRDAAPASASWCSAPGRSASACAWSRASAAPRCW